VIPDWLSLEPMDPVWITLALALGMLARRFGLPALVGFLLAGFVLNAIGAVPGPFLLEAADLGVTLLLFSIGLHLSIRMFGRPEVWAVGLVHMALATTVLTLLLLGVGALGLPPLAGLDPPAAATLGLALAFSSTVFTVKALEDRGAQRTRHGRIAVGVLIIQDVVAVAYLALATGARPQPWALALLALPLLRRPLQRLLDHAGHGELLILFGVVCAMGGAALFEVAGLKADLGALAFGLMLAGSPKAHELSATMDGLKDVFLVGFFVTVGLTVPADASAFLLGGGLLLLLPLKSAGFLGLFSAARLRARTAWQASLDLATYSEFGLIIVAAAVAEDVLPQSALAVMAVAVGASLAVSAPIAARGDVLYDRYRQPLRRLQRRSRLPGDEDLHLRPVEAVVLGLGRIGSPALAAAEHRYPGRVLGVDVSPRVVERHRAAGHYAVVGDATDPEFWSRTEELLARLDWVLLTMATHEANLAAVERLRSRDYRGRLVATSRYPDQADELRELGVDVVFDVYTEAGAGFAADLERRLARGPDPRPDPDPRPEPVPDPGRRGIQRPGGGGPSH
jgi:glutathione-regulated potassium-efflux system ancillary protein KefC